MNLIIALKLLGIWLWALIIKLLHKETKMSKINSPTFINDTQRDAYRFIFEEEFIKENYEIGGETYQEVEWEYDDDNARFLVRLNKKGKNELIIPFCLGSFPMLVTFLKCISQPIEKREDG